MEELPPSEATPTDSPVALPGKAPDPAAISFSVVTREPVDLSRALVVVGFPTVGLVGSIATAHLFESLRLRDMGSVLSPAFPPTAVVRGGLCASPIRILLGEVVCGVHGECEQLCVIHSDITPPAAFISPLAIALVSWAKARGARQLVCLESLQEEGVADEVPLQGVASNEAGRKALATLGVAPLEDGLITGVGGVMLYVASALGLPALCLLAPTREGFPDARGAARLLQRLQPLVPLIGIDERPLYEEAQVLEAAFKLQSERSQRDVKSLSRRADVMYG